MTAAVRHIPLRDPALVMRLKRLGSFHQCRLSFMRTLTRRMAGDGWTFSRPIFEIDDRGVGRAVYTAQGPKRAYSLVAFAHDLPDAQRSDRVIAEAWDTTFTLFDGVPTDADLERLEQNVPLQEAGRVSESELSLSRANRSVRLWKHVVERLASGEQPDPRQVADVGYLMRTTAVYGSGKFGASDRQKISGRAEMQAPFQAEMLSVYLTRTFVRDLVQHMANAKGGQKTAVLDPDIARRLGIGNSTGLGMAPFIVNHPVLFNNWIMAREEAISRVRSRETASLRDIETFLKVLDQSAESVERWTSQHPVQVEKLAALNKDLRALRAFIEGHQFDCEFPWNQLVVWSQDHLSVEGQELVASLILEPFPELVDGLSCCMADSNSDAFCIQGSMPIGELRDLIKRSFDWALEIDWDAPKHCSRAWYVSQEKLEPRLGERFDEPIAPFEQPLAPARDAASAYRDLDAWDAALPVSEFLQRHPRHRHTVRRAQMTRVAPYGEIRDNTIDADVLPIDMLRAKLSFFGATHFDPRSDRWVRICMFGGAPYPEDLTPATADFWVYPETST